MTVDELLQRLQTISEQGSGDDVIQAWDPDTEEWGPVAALTYGGQHGLVRIYTDEP